jgi:1-acyl-sn-glycerol-3-phosphate acyltransferase
LEKIVTPKPVSMVGATLFASLSRAAAAGKMTPEQLAAVRRTTHQISRLAKQSPETLFDSLQKIATEPALCQGIIQALGSEMQLHFRNQAWSLERITGVSKKAEPIEREWLLYELEAVRTAVLASYTELQKAEKEPYAANYPGIRRYRMALRGRLKDLDRIRKAFEKDEPLIPRLEERWIRLRMSYLGEEENGYRAKIQQHLDLLEGLQQFSRGKSSDPLQEEVNARREAYVQVLAKIARAEGGEEPDAKPEDLQKDRERVERLYHEAVEAWFFLSGLMPTDWMGSLKEIGRQMLPAVWWTIPFIVPLLPVISILLLLGAPFSPMVRDLFSGFRSYRGEPMITDGALFPPVDKRWENGTLVIEPKHPVRKSGLSKRALGAAILDTIIYELSLVKAVDFDQARGNLDALVPGWLHTVLAQTGSVLRVEGLENLKGLKDENLILAPTHRGFVEFPIMLGIEHEIGRPNRIMAKDGFLKNPLIRALVGLAMEKYEFIFIDRTAGKDARETMVQAGQKLKVGTKSILLFPGMSRSPTFDFEGERVEGPHYKSKEGVGIMATSGGDFWIVPLAVIGSGVMTPKDLKEQSRGVPTGMTLAVKFGKPFRASSVPRLEGMTDRQYWQAIAARIDEAHQELMGLPLGPLYNAKGPKTIFQANGLNELRKEMKKRLKKLKLYRHSAVVFPPEYHYIEGEEQEIMRLLKDLDFPENERLTVFHAEQDSNGRYRFPSYQIRRRRNPANETDEFEITRS